MQRVPSIWLICGFALLAGCEDLREWKTGPSQVFRGEVIGSDASAHQDSFIRKGFVSHTWLELSFDPGSTDLVAQRDVDAGPPRPAAGTVNTYVCPDGGPHCAASDRTAGPFVDAPLITIDALTHDPLSQYTFPGGGRLRNYMFGLRFEVQSGGRSIGRDATIFVSLMEDHRIEVRAMAPSVLGANEADAPIPALFGVFSLERAAR